MQIFVGGFEALVIEDLLQNLSGGMPESAIHRLPGSFGPHFLTASPCHGYPDLKGFRKGLRQPPRPV